jgi:hypothetical protein
MFLRKYLANILLIVACGFGCYGYFIYSQRASLTTVTRASNKNPKSASSLKALSVLERICTEIPDFNQLDDITRVNQICDWVYQNADIVSKRDFLIDSEKYPIHSQSLDENFRLLFEDKGGHWCAGIASLLKQVYETLGYRSWVYYCGVPDILTHATTLVEVNGTIYIQDAYFNFSYVDDKGYLLPFYKLLRKLADGTPVNIREHMHRSRDVHTTAAINLTNWALARAIPKSFKKISKGHAVYKSETSIHAFKDHWYRT